MYYYKYNCAIGDIYISADDDYLLSVSYSHENDYQEYENQIIKTAFKQIKEYLNKERTIFDLPLVIRGTNFQQKVYYELLKIDYGETQTYKDVAININNEKAVRAVGGACNKNKYSIIVPCHRVVSSSNKLQGYAGGLDIKEKLLKLEGLKIENNYLLKQSK